MSAIAHTRAIMLARTATAALLAPWRQECADCGTIHDGYSPDHHAPDYVSPACPHCFPPCDECGTQDDHRDDVRHAMDDSGRVLCKSCFDREHATCHGCEETCHADRMTETADGPACNDCLRRDYSRCDSCGELHHHDNTRSDDNRTIVCDGCYENGWFTCESCDRILHDDDYAGEGTCRDCRHEEDDDDDLRDSGDNASDLGYFGPGTRHRNRPDPKTRYLGVELECEVTNGYSIGEHADTIIGRLAQGAGAAGIDTRYAVVNPEREFAIAKADGSLSHGFEINTAPATLDVQVKAWTHALATIPSGLKSHDTTTCGLHVHVSRSALSQLTIAKCVVWANDKGNDDFLTAIAGRDSTRYCQRKPKKFGDARQHNPDRYEAINLQNHHTIEFRVFKGTLKHETLLARLEFVAALLDWLPSASASQLTSSGLVAWARTRRKQYPHFHAWMIRKGYLPAPKPRPVKAETEK